MINSAFTIRLTIEIYIIGVVPKLCNPLRNKSMSRFLKFLSLRFIEMTTSNFRCGHGINEFVISLYRECFFSQYNNQIFKFL